MIPFFNTTILSQTKTPNTVQSLYPGYVLTYTILLSHVAHYIFYRKYAHQLSVIYYRQC